MTGRRSSPGFALLMKARADDRRLFNDPPKLNVLSLQDSKQGPGRLPNSPPTLAPFGLQTRAFQGAARQPSNTLRHSAHLSRFLKELK
jgi:hypothetical protein